MVLTVALSFSPGKSAGVWSGASINNSNICLLSNTNMFSGGYSHIVSSLLTLNFQN
ncbi:hypothetical protein T4C_12183 [Trichinella pseudospiralis]|uniref:Uncharacterized protein n=1 Tax=Trichinella pseudospiralis TaxID=6337 RepID=A0A0V1GBN3_TRIPS|nr:hypothetical protein T4C_12183 [Trichinella pseudospiralis]